MKCIYKTKNVVLFCGLAIAIGLSLPLVGGVGKKESPEAYDLVELVVADPSFVLDIRYATTHNFTKTQVYPSGRCFLRSAAAEKLKQVQADLKKWGLGLKIFDGYRPFSFQEIFWQIVPNEHFVGRPVRDADGKPLKGSKHNRGVAVDVTLINVQTGEELQMPSGYDEFSEKASRNYALMDPIAAQNCRLLEEVMVKHGFVPIDSEWWHFDLVGWQEFALLDIPFDAIAEA